MGRKSSRNQDPVEDKGPVLRFYISVRNSDSLKSGVLLASSLSSALLVTTVFYPGFMSRDTISALTSAREEVTNSHLPPMVSYIWRAVELFNTNPSAMHFMQVFLFTISASFIAFRLSGRRAFPAFLINVLALTIPVVIGSLAVIWKDVLNSAFLLAAISLWIISRDAKSRKKLWSSFLATQAVLFMAVTTRHNAILGALPVYFASSATLLRHLCRGKNWASLLIKGGVALLFIISVTAAYSGKLVLDIVSIPSLGKMGSPAEALVDVQILDLAGYAICSAKSPLESSNPILTTQFITDNYDARSVGFNGLLISSVGERSSVSAAWWASLAENPFCLLHHKVEQMKYMVGLNNGPQYYVTEPVIAENPYGYVLQPSHTRDQVVSWVVAASSLPFLKPWFIFLAISLAMLKCWVIDRRKIQSDIIVLLSSGFLFAIGVFATSNSGDSRLLLFTNIVFLLSLVVLVFRSKSLSIASM